MKSILVTMFCCLSFSVSFAQLSNLVDPIRKNELQIKKMMKGYTRVDDLYSSEGKLVLFTYPNYKLSFLLSKNYCTSVHINSTNESWNMDTEMFRWLYEKNYESAGPGKDFWGKMISIVASNGDHGSYPVAIQKINEKSWWIFDQLKYETSK